MGALRTGVALLLSPVLLLLYAVVSLVGLFFPVRFTRWFIFNVPGASWQQGDLSEEQWQPAHLTAPEVEMPEIGSAVAHDYRTEHSIPKARSAPNICVCSWNIFLATNLEKVIAELGAMQPAPDVILLQEDNIYKDVRESTEEKTVFRQAGGAIAKALNMNCIFVPAYYRGRVDDGSVRGCYGMSILSLHDLRNVQTLKCEVRPWLVEQMGDWFYGHRYFPYAEIHLPGHAQAVGVVSVHLPSVGKFSERCAMLDTLLMQMQTASKDTLMLIGGDMNTLAFPFRYAIPFGTTDMYCSLEKEPDALRRKLTSLGLHDPFLNEIGTFPMTGNNKLDWLLFRPTE
mmetsp:Transcript_7599/g.24973  ORF Transcript_7599/g.24973 Transcript_7599/m.24973 type:complete len:342 (+) Transcript_7599:227-1252(+)